MTAMVLLSEWMESQVEFWLPVQGFEDYDVSSFGRVRTWWHYVGNPRGRAVCRNREPIVISGSLHRQGYRTVTLVSTAQRKTFFVHRLVGLAFIANPDNKREINHLCGIKDDNRIGGLVWATRKENQQHAWAYGLLTIEKVTQGQRDIINSEFMEADIIEIRNRRSTGESSISLAKDFGVTNSCICCIVTGVTFKKVGGPRTYGSDYFRLSDADVRVIRQMVGTKAATQKQIARQFNMDPSDVSRIASRKRYAHVPDD